MDGQEERDGRKSVTKVYFLLFEDCGDVRVLLWRRPRAKGASRQTAEGENERTEVSLLATIFPPR